EVHGSLQLCWQVRLGVCALLTSELIRQRERIQRIPCGDYQVLFAVHHIGDRTTRHCRPKPHVPEWLSIHCIKRDEVARRISGKQKSTRGGQQTVRPAAWTRIWVTPTDGAGFIIDRLENRFGEKGSLAASISFRF